jgi:hypothetical protein
MTGSDVLITAPVATRSKNSLFIEASSLQSEGVDVFKSERSTKRAAVAIC